MASSYSADKGSLAKLLFLWGGSLFRDRGLHLQIEKWVLTLRPSVLHTISIAKNTYVHAKML